MIRAVRTLGNVIDVDGGRRSSLPRLSKTPNWSRDRGHRGGARGGHSRHVQRDLGDEAVVPLDRSRAIDGLWFDLDEVLPVRSDDAQHAIKHGLG